MHVETIIEVENENDQSQRQTQKMQAGEESSSQFKRYTVSQIFHQEKNGSINKSDRDENSAVKFKINSKCEQLNIELIED